VSSSSTAAATRDIIDLELATIRSLPEDEAAARDLVRGITDSAVLVMDTDAVLKAGHAAARHDDTKGRGG
jgi:hypothetical protein